MRQSSVNSTPADNDSGVLTPLTQPLTHKLYISFRWNLNSLNRNTGWRNVRLRDGLRSEGQFAQLTSVVNYGTFFIRGWLPRSQRWLIVLGCVVENFLY